MRCLKILTMPLCVSIASLAHAQNPQFPYINSSGTHTVDAGIYDGDNTSGDVIEAGPGKNITINVGDAKDGTVEIHTATRPSWILDAYGNYDSKTGGGAITWNGNLIVDVSASRLDFTPLMVNDGGSSLQFNGNVSVAAANNYNRTSWVYSYVLDVEYYASASFNGDVDFSSVSTNNLGTMWSAGVNAARGESVSVALGSSSDNSVRIHDIVSNAALNSESYGIYGGYDPSYSADYVIDIKGSATIENIVANTSSSNDSNYAWAAGVEAHAGTINFHGDTVIRDVRATGINAEAYGIASYDGGTININTASNNVVRIDGDMDVQGANSSINLNLTNSDSYLRGGVNEADGGLANLVLQNGGTWYVNRTTEIHHVEVDGGVIEIELGGRLEYDAALLLNDSLGTPKLAFHSESESHTGQIVLGSSGSLDFADMTQIEVILGDFYKDTDGSFSILLIDTGLVETAHLDVSLLEAIFKWEDSGESAEGWYLSFIDGEGLYASRINPVPEPAGIALVFGIFAIAAARLKKRRVFFVNKKSC